MKKLEGLFGLKLGEALDESKFKIISKELAHGDYHVEIEEHKTKVFYLKITPFSAPRTWL